MKYRFITLCIFGLLILTDCSDQQDVELTYGAFPIFYRGHLYVEGVIDQVPGNYVFDTGASNLYLDSTHYANHGFQHDHTFIAHLPGAGNTPQEVVVIEDSVQFNFGKNYYKTANIPILKLKPILGDFADGILGMECFYQSILEISYEHEYMRLHESIDSLDLNTFSKIELIERDNRLFIPLHIDINEDLSISGEYQLDFGAGGAVSLTSPVAEQYDLQAAIRNKVQYYTKHGGVGGESRSYDFVANALRLGNFKLDDVVMDFSLDTAGAMVSENHLGLLGNKILDRFHVIIDFIHLDLYLRPVKNFNRPFESSILGFSYIDQSQTRENWRVTGLYETSNAEKAGLQIEDKIREVNGIEVKEINYKEQKEYFNEQNSLILLLERDGDLIELEFDLMPILP
jgi:hypothetical protein